MSSLAPVIPRCEGGREGGREGGNEEIQIKIKFVFVPRLILQSEGRENKASTGGK